VQGVFNGAPACPRARWQWKAETVEPPGHQAHRDCYVEGPVERDDILTRSGGRRRHDLVRGLGPYAKATHAGRVATLLVFSGSAGSSKI